MSALPPAARFAAAALRGLSRTSLPLLLVALSRASDPPLTPLVLAEALLALALLPELCARLVLRAFAAEARVAGGVLHVSGGWRRLEIACGAIEGVRPWRLPLPGAGVTLELGAAGRLRLAANASGSLLAALAQAGVPTPAPGVPAFAFARARAARRRRWWESPLAQVGLASLLPGVIGFQAHQHIAFGSWLGEYYLMGLGAWLASAGRYLATSALYLVLWAGSFRAGLETLAWLASLLAPQRAEAVRRVGEHTTSALYYASIPLLLAARFLA